MKIGYACLIANNDLFKFKTIKRNNITDEKLFEIVNHNIKILEKMIDYNIENEIKMLRITSDLIPFASTEYNTIDWELVFKSEFEIIKNKIKKNDIRISMHPGQYTVLNSPNILVLKNSISDLEYHASVLDLLDETKEGKIIIHIGGVYGEKEEAKKRFIKNYKLLSEKVKSRLIIENDDKSYNVADVLEVSKLTNIPVVFDNLHNELNSTPEDEIILLKKCIATWKTKPKMHYSNQDKNKKGGSHSQTINSTKFMDFYNKIKELEIDIMLEVKDKNISANKCNTLINSSKKKIEKEWARYKYLVLEHSHKGYLEIRESIKENIQAIEFYKNIEKFTEEESEKDFDNALLHVYGYFKNIVDEKEKQQFFKYFNTSKASAKKYLYKLSVKYDEKYLLDSYYFSKYIS